MFGEQDIPNPSSSHAGGASPLLVMPRPDRGISVVAAKRIARSGAGNDEREGSGGHEEDCPLGAGNDEREGSGGR
jgi:hypothetical protein